MGSIPTGQTFSYGHYRSNLGKKNSVSLTEDDLKSHIVKLKTKSEAILAIADSGSSMSFLTEKNGPSTAGIIHINDIQIYPTEDANRNLACYNVEYIIPKERLNIAIETGSWTLQLAPFIIVDGQKANIIDRNLLP